MDRLDAEFCADIEKLAAAKRRRRVPSRDELEGDAAGKTPTEKIADEDKEAAAGRGVDVLVGRQIGKARRRSAAVGAAVASALGIPAAFAAGRRQGAKDARAQKTR